MQVLDNYGCKSLFSGEHGYAGEWLYIYDLCKKSQDKKYREEHGLKNPLLFRFSTEAYWVKDRLKEYPNGVNEKTGEIKYARDRTNCHIVIVAKNYTAIRKLNYILSMASIDGFYGKPRIDLDLLFSLNKDDVYITSSCIAGWKYDDAEDIWLKVHQHFGDNFFLEYQTHNTKEQKELNKKIQRIAKDNNIQTIIGLDTHYINDEDRIKRDNLLKRKGLIYEDEIGWYMDFPTGTEVYQRMKEQGILSDEEILMSMMNTHVFTSGCEEVTIDTDFKIPILDKYQNHNYKERVEELKKLLYDNYIKEENKSDDRAEGIEYELGEIDESTTADYFLTNHDIVKLAIDKYNGHLTTTSRGSASSYYCSKLLGFTTMDRFESEVPIYPERFITKDRILSSHQCPDIDLNVEAQEPFELAGKELLGEHGCYPLLAVGKLGEKSGFKLYADIKGLEPSIANNITSDIDRYNEALKQADDEEDKKNIHIEDYITNKTYLKIFNDSKPYQGIIEQAKVHACGFLIFNGNIRQKDVIGYGDIRYEIGLIRCHSESTGKSTVVACVEGSFLDSYGYVKDDFLIVDVVGIIYKLYKKIGMEVPTVGQLRRMVSNDDLTWQMYKIGATCCLNQCEKPSTTKKVMKYKPKNIKELAAFIAGIRPGFKSLIDGFLDRINYSNGENAIDELLEDCFHYMLYQEAVMKIFTYLGIEMKDSYDTIKKISKKKLKGEALKHVEDTLKEHWLLNIGNLDNFEPVYKVIKDSARYSFNAPHALAMANDSLYEAWVKAHHTSDFYEVTLNHYQDKEDKNKVAALIREAITVFGYSMGKYQYGKDNSKFNVDDSEKVIYPNLASVKGIGKQVLVDLMDIYKSGVNDFIDIYCSIKGTKINATVFKNLVKIGYFKKYGSIKQLLSIIDIYDIWKGSSGDGRKTISKSEVHKLGLDGINLYKYATDRTPSGKISDKQFTNVDWIGLVRELSSRVSNEEYGIGMLVKYQYEVLGYIDYINPQLDKRYVVITELDNTYSPKFKAYCLATGQSAEMKIHKNLNYKEKEIKVSVQECPIEDGDIIYMRSCKQKQRQRKENDEWVNVPDTFDWWINDYYKVVF
jgi:DNA polymerase III alpha subunit